MRFCDSSHLLKTGNYVITWRGVKRLNRKPQLFGGGGALWPETPKISFRIRPVSSINSGHTYIYINIRALRSRSLRDGSLPHKSRFATFVRPCSALRASACLITPFGRWNQVNPTIFEICLLYENNNNKYLN